MNENQNAFPSGRLAALLQESIQRSHTLHRQFLQTRRGGLQDIQGLVALQIQSAQVQGPVAPARVFPVDTHYVRSPALYDSRQLEEFGTGSISNCLGPAYDRYNGRRLPRIPNGDLRMMSRIVSLNACPSDFSRPALVTAEYDVPPDAWYFRDNAYPAFPVAVLLEIALQPCGFLSAALDTYALVPAGDFYFRNLDGEARAFPAGDVRGRTISTRARLLNHVASGETVIQKFGFDLSSDGRVFFQGESTFGYFPAETMSNQVGLDGGRSPVPWLHSAAAAGRLVETLDTRRWQSALPEKPFYRLPSGRLNFNEEVRLVRDGGLYGKGYLFSSRAVNPGDWFYPCHFYQDPVMPGSLGVEAIFESLQVFALASDLGSGICSPRFEPVDSTVPLKWRYRGQITPQNQMMEWEVHIRSVDQQPAGLILFGDASLWVDGLRIYEVKNAAVRVLEG